MFFAHGPAGFLSIAPLRRAWTKLSLKERFLLFLIGFVAGFAPDFDLLYYYLISANSVHRYYFTHAPLPWLFLGLLIYGIGKTIKKPVVGWAGIVVAIASFSHVFLDSIAGRIPWFWPFSGQIYGLTSFSWLPDAVLLNLMLINYLIEFLILGAFFWMIARWLFDKERDRWIFKAVVGVFTAIGIGGVIFMNQHIIHVYLSTYYDDYDKDGIENEKDVDVDGDGLFNTVDSDADGDGIKNSVEIPQIAARYKQIWYAPLNGRLFEQTRRWGIINNPILIHYVLDEAGIMLDPEMEKDYETNPEAYRFPPDQPNFSIQIDHMQAYFRHTGQYLGPKTTPQIGDVVFFERKGELYGGLTVVEDPIGILYADPDLQGNTYSWKSLQAHGTVVGVGRFKK